MIPAPPWFLRLLTNGRPREYAIGAIAFVAGYVIGNGDKKHWKDIARSGDRYFKGFDNHPDNNYHGKHTEREQERRGNYRHYGGRS